MFAPGLFAKYFEVEGPLRLHQVSGKRVAPASRPCIPPPLLIRSQPVSSISSSRVPSRLTPSHPTPSHPIPFQIRRKRVSCDTLGGNISARNPLAYPWLHDIIPHCFADEYDQAPIERFGISPEEEPGFSWRCERHQWLWWRAAVSPLAHIHLLAHDYPVALPTSPGHRNMPPTPFDPFHLYSFQLPLPFTPLPFHLPSPPPPSVFQPPSSPRLSTGKCIQAFQKNYCMVQSRASIPTCRPATYMVGAPHTPPTGTSATSALRGTMRA